MQETGDRKQDRWRNVKGLSEALNTQFPELTSSLTRNIPKWIRDKLFKVLGNKTTYHDASKTVLTLVSCLLALFLMQETGNRKQDRWKNVKGLSEALNTQFPELTSSLTRTTNMLSYWACRSMIVGSKKQDVKMIPYQGAPRPSEGGVADRRADGVGCPSKS